MKAKSKEDRSLNVEERKVVALSRQPMLKSLKRQAVLDLQKRLRTMKEKARDQLNRRRRELRGKEQPRGKHATTEDAGSALKANLLVNALRRIDRDLGRREDDRRKPQSFYSKRALKSVRKMHSEPHPDGGRTASYGMAPKPNKGIAPSGALDSQGQRPVLERSHKVR